MLAANFELSDRRDCVKETRLAIYAMTTHNRENPPSNLGYKLSRRLREKRNSATRNEKYRFGCDEEKYST